MAATHDRLRKHARSAKKDLYDLGRHKSHQVNSGVVQYVRRRPVTFTLIAAGIGLVLGGYWIRRLTTILARTKKRRLKLFFV
jgi:ElaB/YqjD/DUF883 family membrane-anchored ribosome-binding protein